MRFWKPIYGYVWWNSLEPIRRCTLPLCRKSDDSQLFCLIWSFWWCDIIHIACNIPNWSDCVLYIPNQCTMWTSSITPVILIWLFYFYHNFCCHILTESQMQKSRDDLSLDKSLASDSKIILEVNTSSSTGAGSNLAATLTPGSSGKFVPKHRNWAWKT